MEYCERAARGKNLSIGPNFVFGGQHCEEALMELGRAADFGFNSGEG